MYKNVITSENTPDSHKAVIVGQVDGQDRNTWHNVLDNEIGRLAQGYRTTECANIFLFLPVSAVPVNKKIAYPCFVCDICTNKKQKQHVRMAHAGQSFKYPNDVGTPAA